MIVKSKFPAWKTKRGGSSIKYGPRLTQFVVVAIVPSLLLLLLLLFVGFVQGPLNIRGTRTAAAIRVPRALYVLTPNENSSQPRRNFHGSRDFGSIHGRWFSLQPRCGDNIYLCLTFFKYRFTIPELFTCNFIKSGIIYRRLIRIFFWNLAEASIVATEIIFKVFESCKDGIL